MKKGDDVFLLTLVDLLLQLMFLGMVLFAVNSADADPSLDRSTAIKLDSVAKAQGYSSVSDLTDVLSRMVPASLRAWLSSSSQSRGRLFSSTEIDSIKNAVVDSIKRGSGLPPCLFQSVNGRVIAVPVARVVGWDDSVSITSIGDSLVRLLRASGADQVPAGAIRLSEFRRRFLRLSRPDCRYHVVWEERTDRIYARDTVGLIFNRLPR